jgi:hypothetical protein
MRKRENARFVNRREIKEWQRSRTGRRRMKNKKEISGKNGELEKQSPVTGGENTRS